MYKGVIKINIRQYRETDKINFRHICLETANAMDKSEKEKLFLTKLYCDYYIEQEPQNCFALTNDNDIAVGYILCSENMKRYIKAMKLYRISIKELSFIKYLFSWGEAVAHFPALKKCQAHMHIDILPEYQHKGYGSELINTLTNHLSAKGINSVMLVVNSDNVNAVKFYKKNGFTTFLNFGKGILMTKDF